MDIGEGEIRGATNKPRCVLILFDWYEHPKKSTQIIFLQHLREVVLVILVIFSKEVIFDVILFLKVPFPVILGCQNEKFLSPQLPPWGGVTNLNLQ